MLNPPLFGDVDSPARKCGHTRVIDGREPLVCEGPPGHTGRHVRLNGTLPYTWWDDARPASAISDVRQTYATGWRKPHKRRPYVPKG